MANRFFFTFALSLLLSVLNVGYGYTQIIVYQDMRPLNEYIPSMKRHFNRRTLDYFQRMANYEGKGGILYLQSAVDLPAYQKGDTARIRWVFDNRVITHIEVEGVGETTPEDIKNEVFVVSVVPEQTTLYKANIHVKTANDSIVVLKGVANRRVIVVDCDRREYAKVLSGIYYSHQRYREEGLSRFYRHMNSLAGDVPEGLWVYAPEKLSEYIAEISGKEVEEVFDIKARFQKETKRFDSLKWTPDIDYLSTAIEHRLIARGDSTRIKFLFNRVRVRSIKVLGYGKASRDDLRDGEYVVTVAPKKTKLIECYINGGSRAHQRIIVVDPEKYEEVMREWHKCGYSPGYLEKLAGGVPLF